MEERLPEWVDGPRFVAWLEGVRPDYRARLTESQKRAVFRLVDERGKGNLRTVDTICVRLDLHINEIPEEVWTDSPQSRPRSGGAHPPEVKAQAVAMLRDGSTWREVSDLYGIPRGTVKGWQSEARRAA